MRLHIRLALACGMLLLCAALLLGVWIAKIAEHYQAEVTQRLNAGIAMYVTEELALIDVNGVNHAALKELSRRVMTVNPSAEVYLLDPTGQIVAMLVEPSRLQRSRVRLGPIREFLKEAPPRRLMYGDDPTDSGARAAFSVSPVRSTSQELGYLYVVLGGERFDSVVAAVRGSYSLKMGLIVTAGLLLVTLVVGIGIFTALTLPLRTLAQRMALWSAQMENSQSQPVDAAQCPDEITALTRQFDGMAQKIERQLTKITRQDEQRRELIASISHDLRTPLASLHGYLETVLLKGETLLPATRHQYLDVARRHSEHVQRLIAALFELSKLEAGVIVPSMEPFSLGELLQDIALRFRLRAQQLGIELVTEVELHTPLVKGDIALIERIFENLLDNALRHTPKGGRVQLEMKPTSHCMRVSVSDTGQGVAAAELPHVFDRYFRGREQHHGSSSGLGLAIVRHIVELHGQTVSMKSAQGVGTTVEFALPFADSGTAALRS